MKPHGFSAVLPFLCLALPAQVLAAPVRHYPFPPGAPIKQLVEGAGKVFAVAGTKDPNSVDKGGDYLYRWRPDSADWTLLRRVEPRAIDTDDGPISFRGALGSRVFFNLEDAQAHYSDDGGSTWRPCALPVRAPFRSNVVPFAGKLFAVVDGLLRVSTDSGASWPEWVSRVNALQLLPADGLLYARNDSILASSDSGKTWAPRVEGLEKNLLDRYFASSLLPYGDKVLCAISAGVFMTGPGMDRWSPHGTGSESIGRVFLQENQLFGFRGASLFRFDSVAAAWSAYAPWGNGTPMESVAQDRAISGILVKDGRWWVAAGSGIAAYDPSTGDYAWVDRGIHLKEPLPARAVFGHLVSGHLVSVSRNQLFTTPPDGAPKLVRDFRKPGTASGTSTAGTAVIANAEPVDSLIWVMADTLLFRYRFVDGQARLEDSLATRRGKFFCRGTDLISVLTDLDPVTRLSTDSATVSVSRNSGVTFLPFAGKIATSSFSASEVVGGFLGGDTAWIWTNNADLHAYDLKTGDYRFFATGLPVSPRESGLKVQFLRIPAGMLMNQGSLFMLSRDGMRTWTPANEGIPAGYPPSTANRTPIQWLQGRVFFISNNTLYHADDSSLDWKALDLNPLAGPGSRAVPGFAAPEGIFLTRPAEDVIGVPWPDLEAAGTPGRTKRPPSAGPAGMLRKPGGGVFFRGPDSDVDPRGRRIPGS